MELSIRSQPISADGGLTRPPPNELYLKLAPVTVGSLPRLQRLLEEVQHRLLHLLRSRPATPCDFCGYTSIWNCLPSRSKTLAICTLFWKCTLSSSMLCRISSRALISPALVCGELRL